MPTVLTRLNLACRQGETTVLSLRATLTFSETMCSVVLCEIDGGVNLGPVEDAYIVVHQVTVVRGTRPGAGFAGARRASRS